MIDMDWFIYLLLHYSSEYSFHFARYSIPCDCIAWANIEKCRQSIISLWAICYFTCFWIKKKRKITTLIAHSILFLSSSIYSIILQFFIILHLLHKRCRRWWIRNLSKSILFNFYFKLNLSPLIHRLNFIYT